MENARLHEKPRSARAEMGQSTPLPILVTKIQPPGRSSVLLDRPRLLALLPLLRSKQLTVEIARSLGIAPETVKSHLKNIFDKLSVEKRAQAIARAQSLGLLRTV